MDIDDCFNDEFFRYNECNDFEFKQSIIPDNFNKYLETICGFLNTNGGYLIFGIKNNLQMTGITLDTPKLDKFILRFDSIISQKIIIGIDKNKNTHFLTPINLKTNLIFKQNKKFLLISIKPDNNITYQFRNTGIIYYRLGASNYSEKNEKFYSSEEHLNSCNIIKHNLESQHNENTRIFKQCILDLKNELHSKNLSLDLYNTYIKNSLLHSQNNHIILYNNQYNNQCNNQNKSWYNFLYSFIPCLRFIK